MGTNEIGYQKTHWQIRRKCLLFTATHSMISTYFGSITIVLKLPLTRADSTKGLHKYSGLFGAGDVVRDGGTGGGGISGGKVDEVGVGDRFGPRGARLMERLDGSAKWFWII